MLGKFANMRLYFCIQYEFRFKSESPEIVMFLQKIDSAI
jgi:hypothetical protein